MNDDIITRYTASAGIPALPAIPAGEATVSRDGVIRINLFYREHAEDAICTSDGVAAVADGMGGSGHILHHIREAAERPIPRWEGRYDRHPAAGMGSRESSLTIDRLAEIVARNAAGKKGGKSATAGQAKDRFLDMWNEYKRYLDPLGMVKDGTVTATSAALASRVAIAIFTEKLGRYEWRDEKSGRALGEWFVDHVTTALRAMADRNCLDCEQLGKRGDTQKLRALPTTFAAVVPEKKDGRIVAHVFWAGDSRCYALDGTGLHPLTADEEDNGGSVTNYLTGESGIECRLNYRRCEFDTSPRAFLACSDGFFDMGDRSVPEMKMVTRLRDAVAGAESDGEASAKLAEQCRPEIGDDCTVSVITVTESGDGLAELRKLLESAGEKADAIMKKGDELAPAREYVQAGEEGMKKLRDRMIGRLTTKREEFSEKIAKFGKLTERESITGMIASVTCDKDAQSIEEDARELLADQSNARVIVLDGEEGESKVLGERIKEIRAKRAKSKKRLGKGIKRYDKALRDAKKKRADAEEKYERASRKRKGMYEAINPEKQDERSQPKASEACSKYSEADAKAREAKKKLEAAQREVEKAEKTLEEKKAALTKKFEQQSLDELVGELGKRRYTLAPRGGSPAKECVLRAIDKDPGQVVDILAEAGKLVEAGFHESYSKQYLTLLRGKRSPEESADELKKLGEDEAAFSAPYDRCEEQEVLRKKKH